jgi:5'-nucleotidase
MVEFQMRILVTNDDGIDAPGLWAAAKELQKVGEVIVVAPQQEQSGVGTSVSLRRPIKLSKVKAQHGEVETYSVEGTPADCVIIAINSLLARKINLVVSGINRGPNIGNDIFVSGTVGAALQGYLHDIPSLALSLNAYEDLHFQVAAKLASLLAIKIKQGLISRRVLLNVNLPNLPYREIENVDITTLSKQSCCDTVQQVQGGHYQIVRAAQLSPAETHSDICSLQRNSISITPLLFDLNNSLNSSLNHSLLILAPLLHQELYM